MFQRTIRTAVLALAVAALSLGNADAAKYKYGKYRSGGGGGGQGFFVYLEGGLANPRNTDTVFATAESFGGGLNTVSQLTPGWDDEVTGRFTFGYRWANGNRLELRAWGFEADTFASFDGDAGGALHFAVGPPICTSPGPSGCDSYMGATGSPGFVNLTSEISATAVDALWARQEELGDAFTLEWAVGGRFADFEETFVGTQGDNRAIESFQVSKINEATYYGARAAVRGRYSLTSAFSVGAGIGFSFLDGEIEASASQTILGGSGTQITAFDDGRSATIVEFDVRASWRSPGDRWEISLGWEQSTWEELTADLVRNSPGTARPLPDRDEIVFSGVVLGVGIQF